jgi:hypothetical protein
VVCRVPHPCCWLGVGSLSSQVAVGQLVQVVGVLHDWKAVLVAAVLPFARCGFGGFWPGVTGYVFTLACHKSCPLWLAGLIENVCCWLMLLNF